MEKQPFLATRKVQCKTKASSDREKADGFKQLKTRTAIDLLASPGWNEGILSSVRYKLLSTISLGNTCKVPLPEFPVSSTTLLWSHPIQSLLLVCLPVGFHDKSCLVATSLYSKAFKSFIAYETYNSKPDITYLMLMPIAFFQVLIV